MSLILQLLPRVLRATPWIGFMPAGVVAFAMAWVATRQPISAEHRLLPTRLAVLAVVIAVGFVFDDPAAPVTDPAPSPLRLRRLIRSLSAVILAGTLVAVVLPVVATDMNLVSVVADDDDVRAEPPNDTDAQPPEFPGGRIVLEAGTMLGFTLAAASFIARRGEREPGRIATGALLGAYALSWMIPDSHKPWASPGDERWISGAAWWWVALAVSWLAAAGLSWDTRTGRNKPAIGRETTKVARDATSGPEPR